MPGGDALLIKSCLHDFGDEQAIQILRAIRRAMQSHATLLVAETVVPTGNAAGGFYVQQITSCGERFSLIQAQQST